MDNMIAFGLGEANRGKPLMVFDWHKAVDLINANSYKNCGAGLEGDFEWTSGNILVDGKVELYDYTYLASTWATPQLIVYADSESYEILETIDCYVMDNETEWSSGTKFPKEEQQRLLVKK